MNRKTEAEFEEIARECISKAEKVKCSLEDFAEGLKRIIEELRERLSLEGGG